MARLRSHFQSPKATVVSELPQGTVKHHFENLGTLLVESVAGSIGTRGSGNESIQSPLVEVMDGVAHRLLYAAEALGYFRGILAPRTWQKRLVSAQGEGVFRAQPASEGFTLHFEELTYKGWRFHGAHCNSYRSALLMAQ